MKNRIEAQQRKASPRSEHHSVSQARHPKTKRFVKQKANGSSNGSATISTPMTFGLQRILRPQAAFRWILPNLAAITPQYIEVIMRGALAGNHVQQWELFDLMFDTWPELAACNQELVYGVLRKKLIYEPFHEEDEKPTPNAIERSKLISTALRGMEPDPSRDDNALEGTIKDILDGWFRGVTVSEVVWQTLDDKQLGVIAAPKSTFWVHPVCFAFNADGVLGLRDTQPMRNSQWPYPSSTLATQPQPSQLLPFPDYKFLIAIHKAKSGTALGGPLLRPLAWWWCAANFSADWLLNLAQLFGLPFRWANYDANAPQATVDAICNMLQNMGSAGYAAFPTGTTLEMMTSNKEGSDHSPQGELLDRADRYARMLILGQTMSGTRGQTGKGGGQAFGVVEKDVKEDRIDAAGKFAANVINHQLVDSILMLNYGDTDEAPMIRFLEEEEAGLTEAQRDSALAKMGLKIGVDFLRKKYGIPEPAEGEETIGGAVPPGGGFGGDQLGQQGQADDYQGAQDQAINEDEAAQGSEWKDPAHDLNISVVDNHIIRGYMARIESGEELPPVVISGRDPGRIIDGNHRAAAYKKLGRQVPCITASEQSGHPFRGNQYVRLGDTVDTPHGRGKVVSTTYTHAHVSVKGTIRKVLKSDVMKVPEDRYGFPSITHSAENARRLQLNAQLQTKLAKLNEIEDDTLFARELKQLSESIEKEKQHGSQISSS